MTNAVLGSLTRIADFDSNPWELEQLERRDWQTGDYVAADVTGERTRLYHVEITSGDMVPVEAGDRVIGALGDRAATLEGVGSWRDVRRGKMHAMTSAGLLGSFTSLSTLIAQPMSLDYAGHVVRDGTKVTMKQFALRSEAKDFQVPTVLLVGTSMSAGKTATGRQVIADLVARDYRVIGAKLTGAGRYRDVLSFKSAGAEEVFDFVDVGLPSTVVPEDKFREAIRPLLGHIGRLEPDFLVAEAGASPLEPYNGDAAIDELGDGVRCTVLCASDPYAVLGVQQAFGLTPDIVSGPATTTSAGRDLVRRLTGVEAFNILDADSLQGFRAALAARLNLR